MPDRDVIEISTFRGAEVAVADPPVDLLIEVPHGATRTAEFEATAARLRSPLPDGLVDFFHVNTDAGAPELALAVAARFVRLAPGRTARVLRCRLPRTFLDPNRQLDASAADFKAGQVTPGLMPWVTEPADVALLRGLVSRYFARVRGELDRLPSHARVLLLHTYAPRTVGVEVDLDIVTNLRRAYEPEVLPTWPLRPELDVIGQAPDGRFLAPEPVVKALRANLGRLGLALAAGDTYPLHPSTQAYDIAIRLPDRVLCLEVRRDLLAEPFEPFAEMRIGPERVERLAGPLAEALLQGLPA